MPKGYKAGLMVACLIGIIAITVVITLAVAGRAPGLARMGTAVAQSPITLHREPNGSAPASGNLNAGESVEILERFIPRTADTLVLIRSARNQRIYGYAPLSSLDQVRTNNADFDIWHATQLLQKAGPEDLRKRLAAIDEMLKANPLPASRDTDQTYLTLARESVRLANGSIEKPEDARSAVSGAETYLARISEPVATETDDVRSAIQKVQIALGDIPEPEKETTPPPPASAQAELSRLMKDATAAFAAGRYARAAELSQQISTKGQGKRDVAAIVDQAKALQKKAEAAQEDYEKVNIQNR